MSPACLLIWTGEGRIAQFEEGDLERLRRYLSKVDYNHLRETSIWYTYNDRLPSSFIHELCIIYQKPFKDYRVSLPILPSIPSKSVEWKVTGRSHICHCENCNVSRLATCKNKTPASPTASPLNDTWDFYDPSASITQQTHGHTAIQFETTYLHSESMSLPRKRPLAVNFKGKGSLQLEYPGKGLISHEPVRCKLLTFSVDKACHTFCAWRNHVSNGDVNLLTWTKTPKPSAQVKLYLNSLCKSWRFLLTQGHSFLSRMHTIVLNGDSTGSPVEQNILRKLFKAARAWEFFKEIHVRQMEDIRPISKEPWAQSFMEEMRVIESDISRLVNETTRLIERTHIVISIDEAYRSREQNASMKRLSWITLIFLPLLFVSSLYGMNVDILKDNPSWTSYFYIALPLFIIIIIVVIGLKLGILHRIWDRLKLVWETKLQLRKREYTRVSNGDVELAISVIDLDAYSKRLSTNDQIILAAMCGDAYGLNRLLAPGGSVPARSTSRNFLDAALCVAAANGNIEAINVLVQHGAYSDAKCDFRPHGKYFRWANAVRRPTGNTSIRKIWPSDVNEITPLKVAAFGGHMDTFRALLRAGVIFEREHRKMGKHRWSTAVDPEPMEVREVMGDPTKRYIREPQRLHECLRWAAHNDRLEIMNLLLDACEPAMILNSLLLAAYGAVRSGTGELFHALIDRLQTLGPENQPTSENWSHLLLGSCRGSNTSIFQYLIQRVESPTSEQLKQLLGGAADRGTMAIVNKLVSPGKVDFESIMLAVVAATEAGNDVIAVMLIRHAGSFCSFTHLSLFWHAFRVAVELGNMEVVSSLWQVRLRVEGSTGCNCYMDATKDDPTRPCTCNICLLFAARLSGNDDVYSWLKFNLPTAECTHNLQSCIRGQFYTRNTITQLCQRYSKAGDTERLARLFEWGHTLDVMDRTLYMDWWRSINFLGGLTVAAEGGHASTCQLLLDHGAELFDLQDGEMDTGASDDMSIPLSTLRPPRKTLSSLLLPIKRSSAKVPNYDAILSLGTAIPNNYIEVVEVILAAATKRYPSSNRAPLIPLLRQAASVGYLEVTCTILKFDPDKKAPWNPWDVERILEDANLGGNELITELIKKIANYRDSEDEEESDQE
ncbi:cora-like Mg2+ transporter protein-domain-containing protein [Peziza echinospora]|nr:cora-like Mg2+ transporter protein-domain-containing protein [Peziza echinospora]